jgi:rSAM/selenodomain-associated transferase 1
MNERLIVFTRYPEPGRTKTRLIPALGVQGAANLQRQMTEHTLKQVRELQCLRPISVEVRFDGGDLTLMQDWLGHDIVYQPQGSGDLGARMGRSYQTAFGAGIDRVVIIGTDCPGLNAKLMEQAFHQLHTAHDLVLGPAIDGGYYLIGICRFIPELFSGISWGTAEVLQQTVNIAQNLNLSLTYLTPLADVDRPEDLSVWEP